MVFKLIRVDAQEASKIQLVTGKHIIGRGKFLHDDDSDKRVSRNHAELEVTDDTVTLKSLHQNPCFYIKKNTTDTEILQQNSTISLNNGDKFGLIPDNFWYEVIHCPDIPESPLEVSKENEEVGDGEVNVEREDNNEQKREDKDKTSDNDEAIDFDMSEDIEEPNRSASPSLLGAEPNAPVDQESTESYNPDNTVQRPATPEPPADEDSTQNYNADAQKQGTATPSKRTHDAIDSSPVDVKKVKTEPQTPEAKAGPSNDQVGSDTDSKDQKPNVAAPASPPKPAAPMRERCLYGANCYRRNPQHKAQFSHPTDSDWGVGPRGICPYGAACRKADPRHWQQHEHPPGVNPPDPNARRPGMQVVQRNGNIFYINAHSVNFYDDHFQVEDSDGDSVDYDYEF
ncbi:uncharacterized protein LOC142978140 isoform X2 [Anticarsia gemmatalis]|uniref:uncharacterized protein LOC142978140 isoform X2 n=1 Tax=Anticarsia gemmatalis TaxID=129554 RepID=UPI003F7649A4